MFIVSKESGIILNFDNIVELYTGSNGTAVAKDVVCVPSQETIKGRIVNSGIMREQHHNIGGKKTKGHGGS